MINLEHEVIRHLIHGKFLLFREENIDSKLFVLENLPDSVDNDRVRIQSVLNFYYDHYNKYKTLPKGKALLEEFPWVDTDPYLTEPELEFKVLAEKLRIRYAKDVQRTHLISLATASPEEFAQKYVEGSRRVFNIIQSNNFVIKGDGVYDVVDYQKRRVEDSKTLGVSLGFRDIDSHTGGVRPGHLSILAALPKRMKTWFLVAAYLEQLRSGENPVFFTLELTKEELVGRILCLISQVSYSKFYSGLLLPHEWAKIGYAADELASLGGAIVQSPLGNRYVSSILLDAERYDATSIIVDQFSFLQWSGAHFKENEGYKEIVYDIKNSCLMYDIPWYMAAQLGRQSVEDDQFPVAQHLGLTRALEEASDLIMGIKSNDSLKEGRQIMLGVIEARHCESGPNARWVIDYDFYKKTSFQISE